MPKPSFWFKAGSHRHFNSGFFVFFFCFFSFRLFSFRVVFFFINVFAMARWLFTFWLALNTRPICFMPFIYESTISSHFIAMLCDWLFIYPSYLVLIYYSLVGMNESTLSMFTVALLWDYYLIETSFKTFQRVSDIWFDCIFCFLIWCFRLDWNEWINCTKIF